MHSPMQQAQVGLIINVNFDPIINLMQTSNIDCHDEGGKPAHCCYHVIMFLLHHHDMHICQLSCSYKRLQFANFSKQWHKTGIYIVQCKINLINGHD